MRPFTMERLPLLAALLIVGGCSAATGSRSAAFERDVGVGSQSDVVEQVRITMQKYQFQIQQRSEAPPLFWETQWRARAPFPDEQELGVSNAQVRLLIRARERTTASTLGPVLAVRVTVENRVQMLGSDSWDQTLVTDTFREWAAELAQDLRTRLDVGIRVFDPPPCCT
ncbi:MAG: hypothetical protein WEB88_10465 [Gemmatimonadota bacterium]